MGDGVAYWSRWRAKRFLDHLVSTGSLKQAAEAAELTEHQVLARRRTDPAFAALWKAAIEIWYDRLEEMLIEHALRGDAPTPAAATPAAAAPKAAKGSEAGEAGEAANGSEASDDAKGSETGETSKRNDSPAGNMATGTEGAARAEGAIVPGMRIDLVKWLLDLHRGPRTARRNVTVPRATSAETDAALAKYLRARRKRIEAGAIEAGP